MGKSYSLSGYINATLRRSGRTLLVEGPSDKQVIHKVELEQHPDKVGASTIDHAGMLDDPLLSGMGNRAKVLHVQATANSISAHIPKIADVFATITDREWDGLSFVSSVPDPMWEAPPQSSGNYITIGHSIENYHFDVGCVREFLKYAFAEHVTAGLLKAVEDNFQAILAFATVVSLKIRAAGCIVKCGGLVRPEHINFLNGKIYLDGSFGVACASRQIAAAATIVADTNAEIDAAWNGLVGVGFAQWLPHGHIGEEVLWCAVARIAAAEGVDPKVAREIAHGHKQERERFSAQWLSKLSPGDRVPLNLAVDWLHR